MGKPRASTYLSDELGESRLCFEISENFSSFVSSGGSVFLSLARWTSMYSPHCFPLEFHVRQALCEVNILAEDLWGCWLDASHRAQPAFYHFRGSASTRCLSGAINTFLSLFWAGQFCTLRSQLPSKLIMEFPQQRWVSFLREMITPVARRITFSGLLN